MDWRWLVLGALFLGRMCMGLQLQSVAALAEPLRLELGLSYAQIGLLVGLFLLPGLVVAFPATLLGRRIGERRLAPAALLIMAAGSGLAVFAADLFSAAAARLLAGAGGIFVNVFFTRLVADLFLGRRLNLALALLMTSWPLGLALAMVVFPLSAEALGWRETLAMLTLLTALSAALLAALLAAEGRRSGQRRGRKTGAVSGAGDRSPSRLTPHELRLSLLAGFAWSSFTAAGIIHLSFAPPFLTTLGWSLASANAATSLVVWSALLALPLGGWVADRYGVVHPMIQLTTAVAALCLLLVPLGGPVIALTILLGVAWSLPVGPYMGILQAAVSPGARAGAYGIYFTLFYGGIGTLPALAGQLRDATGAATAPLYAAAAVMAIGLPALFAFRRRSLAAGGPS